MNVNSDINRNERVFTVGGMDCPNCATHIAAAVRELPAVADAAVDFLAGRLTVTGHELVADDIVARVRGLGYSIVPFTPQPGRRRIEMQPVVARRRLLEVGLAAALIVTGVAGEAGWPRSLVLGVMVAGTLLGGWQIAWKGIRAAARLKLDINFLMTAASIGAFVIGEWTEAGAIIILFAVAEILEALTVNHSRRAIRSLLSLTPQMAVVVRNGSPIELPAEDVQVGETVLVRPGMVIPVDGVVMSGESAVNQALITGESLPVPRRASDAVLAGTINGDGALQVETRRAPGDTTLDRIVNLVEEAGRSRAQVERFVDRFALIYTPIVVGLAVLAAIVPPLFFGAIWQVWIYRALALLVIACPCALVISTPVTIASAIAGAARRGVLIKGGVYLETLHRTRFVALDKTGTVTFGTPAVRDIFPLNGLTPAGLLRYAASLEAHSEHRIAGAIVDRAHHDGVTLVEPTAFQSFPGRGGAGDIDGTRVWIGNHKLFEELGICDQSLHSLLENIEDAERTAILVGTESKPLGIISVADQIRPEARATVTSLRGAGVKRVVILTGDNHRTGQAVAHAAGVDEVHSELLPQQKVELITRMRSEYGGVVMVGDGVNDAPALAAADVGVAMGGTGTDASLETADVILLTDRLERLPWLIRLSQKAHRIVVANVAFALLTKALFVVLAATGKATLWMAVFADMGVSIIVIFNGMRTLRSK